MAKGKNTILVKLYNDLGEFKMVRVNRNSLDVPNHKAKKYSRKAGKHVEYKAKIFKKK